ncbi:MAG: maleylpyruvate isomerase family mycothiol-dependent enzyme [Actinomycetota bacterium]
MRSPEVDALELQSKELMTLLDELADADWDRASRCPGWTVKELAAHCEGMLQRLVTYNAQAIDGPAEIDRVGYYGYDPDGPREDEPDKSFSESIRDRVIDEVSGRSGDEVREGVRSAIEEMLSGIKEIPGDRVIKRSGHPPIRFDEFVASRVLEFGVHTMDIGHATLRGERIHASAVPIVKEILQGLLAAALPIGMGWDDRTLILAGTGRRPLEPNERFTLGTLASKFPLLR